MSDSAAHIIGDAIFWGLICAAFIRGCMNK